MRGKEYKVDRWVLVLFKLLRHQLEGIYCLRQLSLSLLQGQAGCAVIGGLDVLIGVLNPLFLLPLLPYYLTLFKHYRAQQRVDRAISYPPELVFIHLC